MFNKPWNEVSRSIGVISFTEVSAKQGKCAFLININGGTARFVSVPRLFLKDITLQFSSSSTTPVFQFFLIIQFMYRYTVMPYFSVVGFKALRSKSNRLSPAITSMSSSIFSLSMANFISPMAPNLFSFDVL